MQRVDKLVRHLAPCPSSGIPKPVCLVIGAGAGVGQAVARKFASQGYHACVCRRGPGKVPVSCVVGHLVQPLHSLQNSLSDDTTKTKFEKFAQELGNAHLFLSP